MVSSGKKRSVPAKKKTLKRTTNRAMGSRRRKPGSGNLLKKSVLAILVVLLIGVFGSAGYFGYRAVVASSFFKIDSTMIEVVGFPETEEGKARKDEVLALVQKLVREDPMDEESRKQSFFLDLEEISREVSGFSYVRSASVSRKMPDGLRVSVVQRERAAVFRIDGQSIWFDEDGERLDLASKDDPNVPFVMRGWNPADSDLALEDNRSRIELYRRLKTEWNQHGLTDRVLEVDATDLRSVRVGVRAENGESVIIVGDEDFVNRLKMGLDAMKAGPSQSIDVTNGSPVVVPRARGK
jgi:hypothetical protein